MLQKIIARRAAQIRTLHDRGVFAGVRVPLRNGGTLPAELFAKVALDDLRWLSETDTAGDSRGGAPSWQQLAEDIELLHEVARGRELVPA
jgi:hypothetical protein